MTTPRTIDAMVAAAQDATAAQTAAGDAVRNAAAIAGLSAGAGKPASVPGVSVDPGPADGHGGP